jgi:uncharacterized protein (TIGR02266 family)
MQQRSAVRIVPRNPITVALQRAGAPYAYGVVANISEGGACIWTNAALEPGTSVNLRLSFPKGSQPLDAEGVVVWSGSEGGPSAQGVRYGLQWSPDPERPRERLARMISGSA